MNQRCANQTRCVTAVPIARGQQHQSMTPKINSLQAVSSTKRNLLPCSAPSTGLARSTSTGGGSIVNAGRCLGILAAIGCVGLVPKAAAVVFVDLGSASSYTVIGGSAVTSTGFTVLNGNLGLSPGSAVTGFPPGIVNGSVHVGDAAAGLAKSDLGVAYVNAAASRLISPSAQNSEDPSCSRESTIPRRARSGS